MHGEPLTTTSPRARTRLLMMLTLLSLVPLASGCRDRASTQAPAVDAMASEEAGENEQGAPAEPASRSTALEELLARDGDDIDALERALAEREALLEQRGVPMTAAEDKEKDDADASAAAGADGEGETQAGGEKAGDVANPRCEQVCELADAICKIEGRICQLADKHEGEARYQDSCARAKGDCELATRACQRCAG